MFSDAGLRRAARHPSEQVRGDVLQHASQVLGAHVSRRSVGGLVDVAVSVLIGCACDVTFRAGGNMSIA